MGDINYPPKIFYDFKGSLEILCRLAKLSLLVVVYNRKTMRGLLLIRECPSITELSQQKYDWAYERMQPEQRPPCTMTGP